MLRGGLASLQFSEVDWGGQYKQPHSLSAQLPGEAGGPRNLTPVLLMGKLRPVRQ